MRTRVLKVCWLLLLKCQSQAIALLVQNLSLESSRLDGGALYMLLCRYVRSLDSKQLGGDNSSSSACSPQQYLGHDGEQPDLPNNGKINPCGLIAHSNFNDSFTATANGIPLEIDVSTIVLIG